MLVIVHNPFLQFFHINAITNQPSKLIRYILPIFCQRVLRTLIIHFARPCVSRFDIAGNWILFLTLQEIAPRIVIFKFLGNLIILRVCNQCTK